MPPAPLAYNENARLANLRHYQILDTLPEKTFDSITNFAARYFDVPIAVISLVDQDRQWFKSIIGLDVCETDRDSAFCAYAILDTRPMIVQDAKLDSRFLDNRLVTGAPFIRFYAGVPLITLENHCIGTLCLIDTKPRTLSAVQTDKLAQLAQTVTSRLVLRLGMLKAAALSH